MSEINEKTRTGLPLVMAASLFVSAITGTAAAVASAYGLRDSLLERLTRDLERQAVQIRQERTDQLRNYVSREQFLEWRQGERVRQDGQFYSLLSAIERLSARMNRR